MIDLLLFFHRLQELIFCSHAKGVALGMAMLIVKTSLVKTEVSQQLLD